MFQPQNRDIIIRALSCRSRQGWAHIGTLRFRCALGRNGLGHRKREGDGLTPLGRWPIRRIFFRSDKRRPLRAISLGKLYPTAPVRPTDGWCDKPGDANYNRRVKHPYPATAEHLWRDDDLYDIVVVLGHNACPRVQGDGSAIFMHIADQNEVYELKPTAGCVALRPRNLKTVLKYCHAASHICIMAQ